MQGGYFLYPAVFKTLVLPPILIYTILFFSSPPRPLTILLYLLSFPTLYIIRSYTSAYITHLQAFQHGSIDIPRVKGKWLLNLDIMSDWIKSGSGEEVGRMMVLLSRKYGRTYNTRVFGEDQVISSDPRVLRHVLVDDFENFVKGRKFQERAEGFLGDGIFNADGERWRFHRALTRPFFHPSHVDPRIFQPHIERFLLGLPEKGEGFDIQEKIGRLTLEMAIAWMCGEDVEEMGQVGGVDVRIFGKALSEAQRVVGRRVKIGTVWPLFDLRRDPLQEPMRVIRSFFRPIIERALDRCRQRKKEGYASSSTVKLHLIDRLVDSTEDLKLIGDQLINILMASRDTTSSMLTFLVYALALHPSVAERLRDEIRFVAGGDAVVDKDIIRELRNCRAFINETLRLFSPVPLNIRRTLRASLLPSSDGGPPLYMPANTSIILALVLMQRDKAVWGEDAEVFDIDRWLTPEGLGQKEREGFMSWNYGPRMCLGQPYALTVAHCFLVALLRYLGEDEMMSLAVEHQPVESRMPESWMSEDGDGRGRGGRDKVWICGDVTLAVKGGLWVKVAKGRSTSL